MIIINGIEYDYHHCITKSSTKDRRGGAKILIRKKFHEHWHHVFQDKNVYEIAEICNKMISHEYILRVERRKK